MTRAQELSATIVKELDSVIKTVKAITEDQWRLKTAGENWPVCFAARHIAARAGDLTIEGMVTGNPGLIFQDMNELDTLNAREAREFADCNKEEALDLLRRTSSRVEQLVSGLTDEQLKLPAQKLATGSVTADQWISIFMINHIRGHHNSVGCQRFWTVLGPRDWGEEAPGLRVSLTS